MVNTRVLIKQDVGGLVRGTLRSSWYDRGPNFGSTEGLRTPYNRCENRIECSERYQTEDGWTGRSRTRWRVKLERYDGCMALSEEVWQQVQEDRRTLHERVEGLRLEETDRLRKTTTFYVVFVRGYPRTRLRESDTSIKGLREGSSKVKSVS